MAVGNIQVIVTASAEGHRCSSCIAGQHDNCLAAHHQFRRCTCQCNITRVATRLVRERLGGLA